MNIHLELLLFSILIGVAIIYILHPKSEVILKLPNESNIYICLHYSYYSMDSCIVFIFE